MKILVAIKRVIDHNVSIRVKDDHSGVHTDNVKMSINPFCEIAIEEAVRLKEAGQASQIIAVSIGEEKATEQLRTAMALGADRAILVKTDKKAYPLQVAKALKQVAQDEHVDLILFGKQAIDDDNNQTGQMTAALLGWPQATFASKITPQDGAFLVTREVDGGLQTLSLPKPAVITADLRLNEPRYPKLPNIMAAKKKPLDVVELAALNADEDANVRVLEVLPPAARSQGVMVANVDELLQKLKDDKLI